MVYVTQLATYMLHCSPVDVETLTEDAYFAEAAWAWDKKGFVRYFAYGLWCILHMAYGLCDILHMGYVILCTRHTGYVIFCIWAM